MKIAVYHELPSGGARIATNEMAYFLKQHHTIDLYTLKSKKAIDEKKYYTRIFQFPFKEKEWSGNNFKARLYKDTIELFRLYQLNKKISEFIKQKKYDILFIQASTRVEAPFILRFKSTKKIFFLHDPYMRLLYEPELHPVVGPIYKQAYEKVFRKMLKMLDSRNVKGSDEVFANSHFSNDLFQKTYSKTAKTVYLGVDTHFFKPMKIKKKYDVLFIGSKSFIDGYDTYLLVKQKLMKRYTVNSLLSEENWITDRKQMRKLYNESRVVLCLARNEPFGLIPLEAMSCGVPVIAVHEGGYKETVKNGKTGYLVERDSTKITKKISTILKNKQLLKKLQKQARKHTEENWDKKSAYKALEDALRSIKQS